MTQWFRHDDDAIILLGKTRDDLGGSEYLKVMQHREQGSPPLLNLETEKALHDFVLRSFGKGSSSRRTTARTEALLLRWRNVVCRVRI